MTTRRQIPDDELPPLTAEEARLIEEMELSPSEKAHLIRLVRKDKLPKSRGDQEKRRQYHAEYNRKKRAKRNEFYAKKDIELCRVCHRPLLDEESIRLGVGPICRKYGGAKPQMEE